MFVIQIFSVSMLNRNDMVLSKKSSLVFWAYNVRQPLHFGLNDRSTVLPMDKFVALWFEDISILMIKSILDKPAVNA